MPVLVNPRWEQFAQLCASGKTPTESYISVGYREGNAAKSAARLSQKPLVCSRIEEICSAVSASRVEQVWLTRTFVLGGLKTVFDRAVELDKLSDANTSLRMMGLEIGMFREGVDHNVKFTEPAKMTESELDLWITLWEQRQLASDQAQQPALPAPLTIETTVVDDGEAKS